MTDALRRVLLVYSRVGGGHLSAARALAEAFDTSGRASITLVDAYLECGRFPVSLFPAVYVRLARNHPHLWAALYRGTNTRTEASRLFDPWLRPGFNRLLAATRPDLVISVLPAINGLLASILRPSPARLEVVLTDWSAIHRSWVAPGVQHYTAPTAAARADCVRYGAPPAAVDVVGIPIGEAYALAFDRASVRRDRLTALDLAADRFTILAMVGAEGSPRSLRAIAGLAQLPLDAQLVVICGRNERLRQQVQALPAHLPVRALGFVDYVPDLMGVADLLVTKAGGLTLAEAVCRTVPVIVHDVLPGQEAGNLAYMLQEGAVESAASPAELAAMVGALYAQPVRRAALAARGARLARPDAAHEIARNMLARLPGPNIQHPTRVPRRDAG